MELNQQQVTAWLKIGCAVSGPIGAAILQKTGITQGDYLLYEDIAIYLLPPIIVGVWSWFTNRRASQVARVATMPAADQAAALNKVSDAAKVLIAEAVPNVATVVVKDGAGNGLGKLAESDAHPNIVTESQNAIDTKGP